MKENGKRRDIRYCKDAGTKVITMKARAIALCLVLLVTTASYADPIPSKASLLNGTQNYLRSGIFVPTVTIDRIHAFEKDHWLEWGNPDLYAIVRMDGEEKRTGETSEYDFSPSWKFEQLPNRRSMEIRIEVWDKDGFWSEDDQHDICKFNGDRGFSFLYYVDGSINCPSIYGVDVTTSHDASGVPTIKLFSSGSGGGDGPDTEIWITITVEDLFAYHARVRAERYGQMKSFVGAMRGEFNPVGCVAEEMQRRCYSSMVTVIRAYSVVGTLVPQTAFVFYARGTVTTLDIFYVNLFTGPTKVITFSALPEEIPKSTTCKANFSPNTTPVVEYHGRRLQDCLGNLQGYAAKEKDQYKDIYVLLSTLSQEKSELKSALGDAGEIRMSFSSEVSNSKNDDERKAREYWLNTMEAIIKQLEADQIYIDSMITLAETLKPPTKVTLANLEITQTSATLKWDMNNDKDFKCYRVCCSYYKDSDYVELQEEIQNRGTTSHTFSDLPLGKDCEFWVTVYDLQNLSSKSDVIRRKISTPNLVVSDIRVLPENPIINRSFTVTVTITNIGDEKTDHVWNLNCPILGFHFDTGQQYSSAKFPTEPIQPNQSWTYEQAFLLGDARTYDLEVTVDPFDCLTEPKDDNSQHVKITVIKPDFKITASQQHLTVLQGKSGASTIKLTSVGQWSGTVFLQCTIDSPSKIAIDKASLNQTRLTLSPNGTVDTALVVTIGQNSVPGIATIRVTAKGADIEHHVTITIEVPKPDLTWVYYDYSPKPFKVGDSLLISAALKNAGPGMALGGYTVRLEIWEQISEEELKVVYSIEIEGRQLKPNEFLFFSLQVDYCFAEPMWYQILLTIDPADVVDELNEENNGGEMVFEVV